MKKTRKVLEGDREAGTMREGLDREREKVRLGLDGLESPGSLWVWDHGSHCPVLSAEIMNKDPRGKRQQSHLDNTEFMAPGSGGLAGVNRDGRQ